MANDSVLKETATRRSGRCRPATTPTPATRRSTRSTRTTSKDLQVAWTFSTGVLRGHEGSPLVIGDMMYVHTPFPNTIYALDLAQDGKIVWKYHPQQDPSVIGVMCCDTVYRGLAYADGMLFLHQADTTLVALDAKTGEVKWSVKNGDPAKGETNTATVLPVKDKVIVGISGGEFGVRGSRHRLQHQGRLAGLARLLDRPGRRDAGRPGEDHGARQADRQGQLARELGRRPVEDRRRHHLGLVQLRSRARPRLLRHRQPLDLEPGAAARRQQVLDDDLRA